ncbi:MAG: protein kinase [Planctomycetes bacterium]|nr:protein kinase [Planctomycetota bacterium]
MAEPDDEDPIERIMASLLAVSPLPSDAEVEAAVSSHPEHAATLRQRVRFLRAVTPPPPSAFATRLGGYELGDRIGGGGMGIVHRARELATGRCVALKQIRPEQQWLPAARARFRREIAAVVALSHPGIATVYGAGETDDVPWLAMELVEGTSLQARLETLRPADPATLSAAALAGDPVGNYADAVVRLVSQVAEALVHAHGRGVVHRDIKPSNIMVEAGGRTRLIDFGLAWFEGADSLTGTGTQPGSLAWMSPEQVRGEPVDARTDVWSLGTVLYEALTLHSPFLMPTEAATRASILSARPAPLRDHNARVTADLLAVVATALAPERHRRYATMAAFAGDLRALLAHQPVAARQPSSFVRLSRLCRRHPVRTLLALTGMSLLLLPTALLWQERQAGFRIQREADRAAAAERKSRADASAAWQVVGFLENVFEEAAPEYGDGSNATLRDALERGIREIRSGVHADPALRARLLEAMSRACLKTGWAEEAVALMGEADALLDQLPAPEAREREQRAWHRAQLLRLQGRWHDYGEAVQNLLDQPGVQPAFAATLQLQLAELARRDGRFDEARARFEAGLSAMRATAGTEDRALVRPLLGYAELLLHTEGAGATVPHVEAAAAISARIPIHLPERGWALARIAWFYEAWARYEEARKLAEVALAEADTGGIAPRHPLRGILHCLIATQTSLLNDRRAAMVHGERAIDLLRGASTATGVHLARALNVTADAALFLGDAARGRQWADEALQVASKLAEPDERLLAQIHFTRATSPAFPLTREQRIAEYELMLQHAANAPTMQPDLISRAMAELAQALVRAGRSPEASTVMERLRTRMAGAATEPSVLRAQVLALSCWTTAKLGDLPAAATLAEQAWAMLEACRATDSPTGALTARYLGWIRMQSRQFEPAAASLEQALGLIRKHHGPAQCGEVVDMLVTTNFRLGRFAANEPLLRESLTIENPPPGTSPRPLRHSMLGRVLHELGRHDEATEQIDLALTAFEKWERVHLELSAQTIETALLIAQGQADAGSRRTRLERVRAFALRVLPAEHRLHGKIAEALAQ